MSYVYGNCFVHESSTHAEVLGADLENGAHKAAMYDEDGLVVLATDSSKAFGVFLSNTGENLSKGDSVTLVVSNICLIQTGEAVNRGDLLSINEKGQAVVAKTGKVVFGRAFSSATKENSLVQVMVCPVGAVLGG